MARKFNAFLGEQLKDKEFKREYDSLDGEYQIINALITARAEKKLTQEGLSKLTGIAQADISRLESGNSNPSLKTLKRIATGLGKNLKIDLK